MLEISLLVLLVVGQIAQIGAIVWYVRQANTGVRLANAEYQQANADLRKTNAALQRLNTVLSTHSVGAPAAGAQKLGRALLGARLAARTQE